MSILGNFFGEFRALAQWIVVGSISYLPLTSLGHCSFSVLLWVGVGTSLERVRGDRDTATVPSSGLVLGCA